jgi:hypothetical protein
VKVEGELEICFGGSQPDYASTDRLLRLHIAVGRSLLPAFSRNITLDEKGLSENGCTRSIG